MNENVESTAPVEEEMTLEELAALCQNRAKTYAFIARLYRVEVDEALLEEMKGLRFPANTGNRKVDEGNRLIADYLNNMWENALNELAVDYARVFIGHGLNAFSAAYPYESVYTSEKRLLMQEARDEVLAIYRSAGLDKRAGWRESEDHLAVELEFMQVLANRSAEALLLGDEEKALGLFTTQKNFLEDHLISWTPMLTLDMRRFAKTKLYIGLAALTEGYLENEGEFLTAILNDEE